MEVLSATRMRCRPRATASAALLLAAACGGGGGGEAGTTEPGASAGLANGTMTATVNGVAWRASLSVQATVQRSPAGQISVFQISGVDTVGVPVTRARQIILTGGMTTPLAVGTYRLAGPAAGSPGTVSGQFNQATAIWNTLPGAGAAAGSGTLTVTTLTDTRIAGTFDFTANAASSNPADARQPTTVTQGRFDVALRAP